MGKKEKKRKGKVFSDNKWWRYYREMVNGGEIFLIISGLHNTYSISSYKFCITRIELGPQPYVKTYCHLCLMSYVLW